MSRYPPYCKASLAKAQTHAHEKPFHFCMIAMSCTLPIPDLGGTSAEYGAFPPHRHSAKIAQALVSLCIACERRGEASKAVCRIAAINILAEGSNGRM